MKWKTLEAANGALNLSSLPGLTYQVCPIFPAARAAGFMRPPHPRLRGGLSTAKSPQASTPLAGLAPFDLG
ncbi:hypothetical protein Mal33_02380 [Rosistilla oblonga]|uniref:Uncharacterized protein n=1 Tax=Rosistilla oblonga TaxID=2527990 RepID=A0A518IMH1_9BACT|nr:hypothetical protein Mal33_02380 [Rosistilla oblonga]